MLQDGIGARSGINYSTSKEDAERFNMYRLFQFETMS